MKASVKPSWVSLTLPHSPLAALPEAAVAFDEESYAQQPYWICMQSVTEPMCCAAR